MRWGCCRRQAARAGGLGLAMKIVDGDLTGRARPVAVLEALRQLGVLTEEDLAGAGEMAHRRGAQPPGRGGGAGASRFHAARRQVTAGGQ